VSQKPDVPSPERMVDSLRVDLGGEMGGIIIINKDERGQATGEKEEPPNKRKKKSRYRP
jgi:hypothetical protein